LFKLKARGREGLQKVKPYAYVFILKKKIFSRTIWPISIKLGKNHPWVKGILIVQIKGQVHFKGEINTKMEWSHSKILFSRTTEPEELIFTWKLSDILSIQVWESGGSTIRKTILTIFGFPTFSA
jgi:hypothetical protein